jgi:catechol-2,3-dioxygenase
MMQIRQVQLSCQDLSAQHTFYAEHLTLPCRLYADRLVVSVGQSEMVFSEHAGPPAIAHVAWNIPANALPAAAAWLRERVALLSDSTGEHIFISAEPWNAQAIYFVDPAGHILELIARQRLPAAAQPFTPDQILAISEVGIANDDLPTAVARATQQLGITVFSGAGSETFTAIGDDEGLLIMVKHGRIWFPNTGVPAAMIPLTVELVQGGQQFRLSGPPYLIEPIA